MLDRALGGARLGAYPYTTRAQIRAYMWLKIKFSFRGSEAWCLVVDG